MRLTNNAMELIYESVIESKFQDTDAFPHAE
jgi:hypothetical protein